jgi:hypothetical protein
VRVRLSPAVEVGLCNPTRWAAVRAERIDITSPLRSGWPAPRLCADMAALGASSSLSYADLSSDGVAVQATFTDLLHLMKARSGWLLRLKHALGACLTTPHKTRRAKPIARGAVRALQADQHLRASSGCHFFKHSPRAAVDMERKTVAQYQGLTGSTACKADDWRN